METTLLEYVNGEDIAEEYLIEQLEIVINELKLNQLYYPLCNGE